MCRLLFLPPNIERKEALNILIRMYGYHEHEHGTGESYIDKNGKFVINKYGARLEAVIKKKKVFLDHLPHNGWTICHLRKISVGHQCRENAQPFLSLDGSIALMHNGTISGTNLLSIYLQTCLGYEGTSDSRAITEVVSRIGAKNLVDELNWGGVLGVLNADGTLEVAKISGQLAAHVLPNGAFLMASEFNDEKYKNTELNNGYFKFNKTGQLINHQPKDFHWGGYEKVTYTNFAGVHYQGAQANYENILQPKIQDNLPPGECWG